MLTKEQELEYGKKIYEYVTSEKDGKTLSKAEKEELKKSANEAHLKLFENNLALAYNLANKMYNQVTDVSNYEKEDLQQDVIIILNKAIWGYNPNKNCKLSTYITPIIKRDLSRVIHTNRLIRVPNNVNYQYMVIKRARKRYNELLEKNEIKMSEMEYVLATEKITREQYFDTLTTYQDMSYFEFQVDEDNPNLKLEGLLGQTDKMCNDVVFNDYLDDIIDSKLTKEERELIYYEYGANEKSSNWKEFLLENNYTEELYKKRLELVHSKLKEILMKEGYQC